MVASTFARALPILPLASAVRQVSRGPVAVPLEAAATHDPLARPCALATPRNALFVAEMQFPCALLCTCADVDVTPTNAAAAADRQRTSVDARERLNCMVPPGPWRREIRSLMSRARERRQRKR